MMIQGMLMIQGDTLALLLCAIRHHTCTDTVRACRAISRTHVFIRTQVLLAHGRDEKLHG